MAYPTTKPDDATELTWEIAQLFPAQGHWCEEEYLALDTNHLIELSHGQLEVLPMPTQSHQLLVIALFELLLNFVREGQLGTVLLAPMRVQLSPGKFREPDILFMRAEHDDRRSDRFWEGADLVMEIVCPDDPERDKVTKRREYAQAGIPEYWIVDPTNASITVLTLRGQEYALHAEFVTGETASSVLLEGFRVDVSDVFSEARR
ncbi:MAG: Uma2 family endonuclease [Caldilineaceae bacterium SB0670_bin_27]|uniref:Uma2 family endonuclease n=1 Tax=Caldilineaceae bacterium SB0664_bin_27 TaxID=2605260 RepID=A0A6B0YLY2_9CHLR|nr:Uma2 family endonuclease [Caldilineaceae bacterium SB0664_bin_27]MYJ77119.1 Uma2 family endonuclease [Caldilineaceae bacterium SB0670_bin_27]